MLYCEGQHRKHSVAVADYQRVFKETFDSGGSASVGGTASSRRIQLTSPAFPDCTLSPGPQGNHSRPFRKLPAARLFLLFCRRRSWRWTKVIWNLCSASRSSTSSGGSTRDGLWAGCRRTGGCREDSGNKENKASYWPARPHLFLLLM